MLLIKNWRLLSLLNVDAKIYSKILANRMYQVLPGIIHHDQTGFMKGRKIPHNMCKSIDVIDITNKEQIR